MRVHEPAALHCLHARRGSHQSVSDSRRKRVAYRSRKLPSNQSTFTLVRVETWHSSIAPSQGPGLSAAQEAAQPAVYRGGGYLCALWGPGTAGCHPRPEVQIQVGGRCAAGSRNTHRKSTVASLHARWAVGVCILLCVLGCGHTKLETHRAGHPAGENAFNSVMFFCVVLDTIHCSIIVARRSARGTGREREG